MKPKCHFLLALPDDDVSIGLVDDVITVNNL